MKNRLKYRIFTIITLLLFLYCCINGNNKKSSHDVKGVSFPEEFESFLMNFKEKQLPLTINRSDLQFYGLTVYDSVTGSYKTSAFHVIPTKFIKFLCKDTFNNNSSYRALYKIRFQDNLILIYVKDVINDNEEDPGTWIMLNTYNGNGLLLDTLCIAGSKTDEIEKYVSITLNKNIEINTKAYQFLPDNPEIQALHAVQLLQKSIIDEKGNIKLITSTEKKDYFKLENNEFKAYKRN